MERTLKNKLPNGAFNDVEPAHRLIMKGVRGKGNRTTEAPFQVGLVRSRLFGWQVNFRGVRGTPDFYFANSRLAVFVDGCFWHGCDSCGHIPSKNRPFWQAKIQRNRERDLRNTAILRRHGYSVLRFWEHDIKYSLELCIIKVRKRLANRGQHLQPPTKNITW